MGRPLTLEPSRTTAFNLTDRHIDWIKQEAQKRGVSKSEVARQAIEALEALRNQQREPKKDAS